MYTVKQQELIQHTRKKVVDYLDRNTAPGHGSDHATRVANWAVKIATAENRNVFLCEIAGWLHDVGRALEHASGNTKRHHELSYEICQDWFRNDPEFKKLTKKEKLILLYSVRYHWNNAADKYVEAIILRDADKLDLFGKIGIKRAEEFLNYDQDKINLSIRNKANDAFWIRTKTARKFFNKYKMFEPIYKYELKVLKSKIRPVEL